MITKTDSQGNTQIEINLFPGQRVPDPGEPKFNFVGVVQIQTHNICNRKCEWCPNSYLEKEYGEMSLHTFALIMQQLQDANYSNRIHLYLQNEPLLDKRMPQFTRIAKSMMPNNEVLIYTNGDYLTDDVCDELFEAGMRGIIANCYDDNGEELAQRIHRSIEKHPGQIVFNTLDYLKNTFYNRAGKVDVKSCGKHPYPWCEWLFTKMYINYRGDAILCCSDYENEVILGNIHKNSIDDIFHGAKYHLYRCAHVAGKAREMKLCDKCNRLD